MEGYMITTVDDIPVTHRVNDIDFFPLVIFKTLEEAERYVHGNNRIKKVKIYPNKKDLAPLTCYNRGTK